MQKRPHGATQCTVKSLPCAWKFRKRISTHTTAPLFFFCRGTVQAFGRGRRPHVVNERSDSGDHVRPPGHNGIASGGSRDFGLPLFAGEPSKPLDGGGQPSRCERAERSEDHVRRRPQRDCSGGTDLFGGLAPAEVEERSDVYSTGATSVFVRRRLRHQAEERSDVYPKGAATD